MANRTGQCDRCHAWGPLRPRGSCHRCVAWKARGGSDGLCLRCRHPGLVNRDQVCRLCTIEVRILPDPQWSHAALSRVPGPPRHLQLPLQLPGISPPKATAVRGAAALPGQVPAVGVWKMVPGLNSGRELDAPGICPPQIPGQLPLFPRQPRTFTREHALRIAGRDFPEGVRVREAAERLRTREHQTPDWRSRVLEMVPLALASREAGELLVDEPIVAELPRQRAAVAAVLREAGLLRPHLGSGLAQTGYQRDLSHKVSCAHCLAWAGDAMSLCDCCREWARDLDKRPGPCDRCGRTWPLKDGECRFCLQVQHDHSGDGPVIEQLWFNGFAPGLRTRRPGARVRTPGLQHPGAREAGGEPQRGLTPVPPIDTQPALFAMPDPAWLKHVSGPRQSALFPQPPRDWLRVRDREPPALHPAASELVTEFKRYAISQQWSLCARDTHLRTLRLLLGWLSLAAPIPEADIQAVAALGPGWSGRRLIPFLQERGLLLPVEKRDRDHAAVERLLTGLPLQIRSEAEVWVRVMRGEGHRPSGVIDWATIRAYAHSSFPILRRWAERIGSLREVTRHDINTAVRECTGQRGHRRQTSLRSLFRALKRERVIHDPACGVAFPAVETVRRPISSDRLAGLLDATPGPMAKAVVALVAIHALRPIDIVRQQLSDIDQSAGRMTVRRRFGHHTIYLDTVTQRLLAAWLEERARRWPCGTNPHLFVTQQTALDPAGPTLMKYTLWVTFRVLGLTPTQLRVDRILDEAHETADPVHLMHLFGIADTTAMKYVKAAHPEHFLKNSAQG